MSSQELNNQIDYDTSLNVIDSSLNLFNTDYINGISSISYLGSEPAIFSNSFE